MDTREPEKPAAAPPGSPNGLLQQYPWIVYVLPLAVFMLVGTFEPKPEPPAEPSSWTLPYSAYPAVLPLKILLTATAIGLAWPSYRRFGGRVSPLALVVEEEEEAEEEGLGMWKGDSGTAAQCGRPGFLGWLPSWAAACGVPLTRLEETRRSPCPGIRISGGAIHRPGLRDRGGGRILLAWFLDAVRHAAGLVERPVSARRIRQPWWSARSCRCLCTPPNCWQPLCGSAWSPG